MKFLWLISSCYLSISDAMTIKPGYSLSFVALNLCVSKSIKSVSIFIDFQGVIFLNKIVYYNDILEIYQKRKNFSIQINLDYCRY